MKFEKLLLIISIFSTVSMLPSCRKSVAKNERVELQCLPSITPILDSSPTRTPDLNSPVRKVDFENFTYQYPELPDEKITLKNGRREKTDEEDGAGLGKIEYGDVTNDGEDEALIRIRPITGGNCQCEMVFIYTMERGQPKLLWSFDTDDRAHGGLKRLYGENGKLVVETFGDNKFENDEWEFKFPKKITGYCCPTAFTKIRFKWNGEKFLTEGKPGVFDYDWKNSKQ